MDPRHTLYQTFGKLAVDSVETMSARTDQEAAQVQATSGVTPESIEKKLKEGLSAVYVEIADLSGMLDLLLVLRCISLPASSSWFFHVSLPLGVFLVIFKHPAAKCELHSHITVEARGR
jgi:hypothetical protein